MIDADYVVHNANEIPSPSLLFFKEKIAENIDKAVSIAQDPRRLRPHVKTHKTKEIVHLQMNAGIERFKCATIAEAEMLAQCAAKDVLIAYPMVGPNIKRLIALIKTYPATRFTTIIDNRLSADALSESAVSQKTTVEVLLEVDPGLHRTGVDTGTAAVELYRHIADSEGLLPAGIHCYDGNNHQTEKNERIQAARRCYTEISALRETLLRMELPVDTIVLGGTPTFPIYAEYSDVEVSPGTCFLNDWNYSSSYKDMDFACAALVLSRVISINPRQSTFTLDLGSKGIAADPQGDRGTIINRDDSRPLFQNEEHWVFSTSGTTLPRIGEVLYVLPTHICPTSALYSEACVIDSEGTWSSSWKIAARNRKLTI